MTLTNHKTFISEETTMAIRKKTRLDTAAGAVERMASLQTKIEPPITLNDRELTYFDAIVKDREASAWSAQHLIFAANQAKTMVQIDDANADIAERGMSITSEKGWNAPNPMVSVKMQLTNSLLAQMKALGMSASQKGLSTPEQKKRNEADVHAREVLEKAKDESLLA
jgi:phage terminase small subunit